VDGEDKGRNYAMENYNGGFRCGQRSLKSKIAELKSDYAELKAKNAKLIDALITSCEITELHAYYVIEQVTMLTGLTWPEALEIYHKRRSQDER